MRDILDVCKDKVIKYDVKIYLLEHLWETKNNTRNKQIIRSMAKEKLGDSVCIVSEILNEKCNTNTALAREFGVSRATISWHVKNLKETGLIKETKTGRNIIYKINTSYNTLMRRYR